MLDNLLFVDYLGNFLRSQIKTFELRYIFLYPSCLLLRILLDSFTEVSGVFDPPKIILNIVFKK